MSSVSKPALSIPRHSASHGKEQATVTVLPDSRHMAVHKICAWPCCRHYMLMRIVWGQIGLTIGVECLLAILLREGVLGAASAKGKVAPITPVRLHAHAHTSSHSPLLCMLHAQPSQPYLSNHPQSHEPLGALTSLEHGLACSIVRQYRIVVCAQVAPFIKPLRCRTQTAWQNLGSLSLETAVPSMPAWTPKAVRRSACWR